MAALVLWVLLLAQLCVFSCIDAQHGHRRSGRFSESRVDGLEGFGKGSGGMGGVSAGKGDAELELPFCFLFF